MGDGAGLTSQLVIHIEGYPDEVVVAGTVLGADMETPAITADITTTRVTADVVVQVIPAEL
jgi:hypothetical protein